MISQKISNSLIERMNSSRNSPESSKNTSYSSNGDYSNNTLRLIKSRNKSNGSLSSDKIPHHVLDDALSINATSSKLNSNISVNCASDNLKQISMFSQSTVDIPIVASDTAMQRYNSNMITLGLASNDNHNNNQLDSDDDTVSNSSQNKHVNETTNGLKRMGFNGNNDKHTTTNNQLDDDDLPRNGLKGINTETFDNSGTITMSGLQPYHDNKNTNGARMNGTVGETNDNLFDLKGSYLSIMLKRYKILLPLLKRGFLVTPTSDYDLWLFTTSCGHRHIDPLKLAMHLIMLFGIDFLKLFQTSNDILEVMNSSEIQLHFTSMNG